MKRTLLLTAFLLATLAWATAQTSSTDASRQTTPGAQTGASQSQSTAPGASQTAPSTSSPTTSGAAGQTGAQSSPTGAAHAPVMQGCLGGSKGAFTITDQGGKSYKLNIPATADATPLASHVGESVMVMGNVNSTGSSPSIDVQQIGRGTGTCPGSGSAAPQTH